MRSPNAKPQKNAGKNGTPQWNGQDSPQLTSLTNPATASTRSNISLEQENT